jgi:hypothetical protein
MRYRLRTLMILLTVGPPALAGVWLAWPTIALVLLQAVLFLVVGAVLLAIAIPFAMVLATIADVVIDFCERR